MRPLPQSSRRETSSCAALARQTGTSQQAGHSSVGRASDCRALQQSDGPWFDSGWPDGMTNPLAGACVLKTDASAARRARSPRPRPSCREGDRRLGPLSPPGRPPNWERRAPGRASSEARDAARSQRLLSVACHGLARLRGRGGGSARRPPRGGRVGRAGWRAKAVRVSISLRECADYHRATVRRSS